MTRFEPPRVVIADVGTDAALYSEPGNVVLVLRPGQSFSNAVAAAQQCLPDKHPDLIRSVVRTYLPEAPDFELPVATPVRHVPPPEPEPTRPWYTRRRMLVAGLTVVALLLVSGGWGLARLGLGGQTDDSAAAPGSTDDAAATYAGSFAPFEEEAFQQFARRGEMACEQVDELRARCTDWEGAVLYSEATVGPRSTMFSFSYGQHRVTLRVFPTENAAQRWLSETATVELYPSASGVGRFVLWGTDQGKLEGYSRLLHQAEADRDKSARDENARDASARDEDAAEAGGEPGGKAAGKAAGKAEGKAEGDAARDSGDVPDSAPSSEQDGEQGDAARDSVGESSGAAATVTEEIGVSAQVPDAVPAELGALMLATIGVDSAQAERATEVGLEDALAPVQVVAVKMTLGMPTEPPDGQVADPPGVDDVDIVGGEDAEDPGTLQDPTDAETDAEPAPPAGGPTDEQDEPVDQPKPTEQPSQPSEESSEPAEQPGPTPEPSATSTPGPSPTIEITKKAPTKVPSPAPRPTGTDSGGADSGGTGSGGTGSGGADSGDAGSGAGDNADPDTADVEDKSDTGAGAAPSTGEPGARGSGTDGSGVDGSGADGSGTDESGAADSGTADSGGFDDAGGSDGGGSSGDHEPDGRGPGGDEVARRPQELPEVTRAR